MDVNFIRRNYKSINQDPIARAAALVRIIMRGSIRRATRAKKTTYHRRGPLKGQMRSKAGMLSQSPSPPGKPPKARFGMPRYLDPRKPKPKKPPYTPFKHINFEVNQEGTAAVIGHKLLPIKKQDPAKTPMQAHEFAESVLIKTKDTSVFQKVARKRARTPKQKRAARRLYLQGRLKHKRKAKVTTRRVKMPKRPFAGPALTKARNKIGQFWAGRINKGTVKKTKTVI